MYEDYSSIESRLDELRTNIFLIGIIIGLTCFGILMLIISAFYTSVKIQFKLEVFDEIEKRNKKFQQFFYAA